MSGQSVLSINPSQNIDSSGGSGASEANKGHGDNGFADLVSQQMKLNDQNQGKEQIASGGKDRPAEADEAASTDVDLKNDSVEKNELKTEAENKQQKNNLISAPIDGDSSSEDDVLVDDSVIPSEVEELLNWLPRSQIVSTNVNSGVNSAGEFSSENDDVINVDDNTKVNTDEFFWGKELKETSQVTINNQKAAGAIDTFIQQNQISAQSIKLDTSSESAKVNSSELKIESVGFKSAGEYEAKIQARNNTSALQVNEIKVVNVQTEVLVDENIKYVNEGDRAELDIDKVKMASQHSNSELAFKTKAKQASIETEAVKSVPMVRQNNVSDVIAPETEGELPVDEIQLNIKNELTAEKEMLKQDTPLASEQLKSASGVATQESSDVKTNDERITIDPSVQFKELDDNSSEIKGVNVQANSPTPVAQQTNTTIKQHSEASASESNQSTQSKAEITGGASNSEEGMSEEQNQNNSQQPAKKEHADRQQSSSNSTFGLGAQSTAEGVKSTSVVPNGVTVESSQMSSQLKASAPSIQSEVISINRRDFVNQLNDKVMIMINQRLQQFDIRLDPPELGSMQIKVSVQNEQAMVSFVVQNQQAKDAVEQNINRLREMMQEQGLDVADANVKEQSQNQGDEHGEEKSESMENSDLLNEDDTDQIVTNLVDSSTKGVDYYV